jgi:uncharacterized protein YcnI
MRADHRLAARSFSAVAVDKDVGMRRLVLFVALFLAITAPALGHVEVKPEEVARGAAATLTFSVPNEEDNAATVKIEIAIPSEIAISGVSPGDAPAGWTAAVGTDRVTWSGGKLTGEEEEDFAIHIEALPTGATDELVFKALQTYDNGTVVRWIDETPAGGAEPEHPAPVVKLTGAVTDTTAGKTTPTTETHIATPGVTKSDKSNKAGIALVVALAAFVVTFLAVYALRGRRGR